MPTNLPMSSRFFPSSLLTPSISLKSRSRAETGILPVRIACHVLSRNCSWLLMAAESGAAEGRVFRSEMPGSLRAKPLGLKNRREFKHFDRPRRILWRRRKRQFFFYCVSWKFWERLSSKA